MDIIYIPNARVVNVGPLTRSKSIREALGTYTIDASDKVSEFKRNISKSVRYYRQRSKLSAIS
jgi:hypothetical protein